MKKLIILKFVLFISCLSAQAVSVHVLAWDNDIAARRLNISYGNRVAPIEQMHPHARSAVIPIPAGSENIHLIVTDRLAEDGSPLTLPLAINPVMERVLILLTPDKAAPSGLKIIVLDDSLAGFKWGTMRIVNLTSKKLILNYDKKKALITNGWKPTTVAAGGDERNIAVKFYLDPKSRPIYSSIWRHKDELRKLIFITPANGKEKERGPVKLKFINENRRVLEEVNT